MNMNKISYTLENSPYKYNIFRNGNIWLKGFNECFPALHYCVSYAKRSNSLLDLWRTYADGSHDLIQTWN